MATQPLDIIKMAYKNIGALASGENLESSMANDAFDLLNDLLDQWSNSPYMIYNVNEIIFNLVSNQYVYTVGVGQQVNVAPPLVINQAFVRVSNIDYPVAILAVDDYELIGLKSLNGPWPRGLYYNLGAPNATLSVWPNPSSGEMHLFANSLLTNFTTINDTVVLPQGYKMALIWNLSQLLIPQFPSGASPEVISRVDKFASEGLAHIRRTNMQPMPVSRMDDVLVATRQKDAGWILTGGF